MNRGRRPIGSKPFVSGGIYNPNSIANPGVQLGNEKLADNIAMQSPIDTTAFSQAEAVPLPIKVKQEPPVIDTVESAAATDNKIESMDVSEDNSNGKIPFKKIFQKRKKSSERSRDKKIRQNRQLRKSMLPKNALMALNEVKGITISDFTVNNNADGGFTAIVTVNSNQYEGKGQSKMSAKNQACEKALRDYILAKMMPKPKKATESPVEPDSSSSNDNMDDDLPMLNLASFAIFKLFAEWEKEGYTVPEMHPTISTNTAVTPPADATDTAPVAPKEPKKPPIRTELPSNWETMHPATLLCIMRPGITYMNYGKNENKTNAVQRLGVIIDNQEFTANGRSKKIARRNVAVNACNSLFGTNFPYEEY